MLILGWIEPKRDKIREFRDNVLQSILMKPPDGIEIIDSYVVLPCRADIILFEAKDEATILQFLSATKLVETTDLFWITPVIKHKDAFRVKDQAIPMWEEKGIH